MIEDFCAINMNEFRQKYLVEKALDTSYEPIVGGTLSKKASALNIGSAETLTSWATTIHNQIATYVKRQKRKYPDVIINLRVDGMEDMLTQSAAIIIIDINVEDRNNQIEISVFDNNRVLIRYDKEIANMAKISDKKFFDDKNKVAKWVKSVLEVILVRKTEEIARERELYDY